MMYTGKHGFTLVETLVAVLIIVILITMAVPMYQRAVEKSRVAEVSIALKRIGESKLRIMDNKDIGTFNKQFGLNELDVQNPTNSDFTYSLWVSDSFPNAVCATRARGDNQGTIFLFLGETASESCSCDTTNYAAQSVCGGYCNQARRLFCQNAPGTSSCDSYGMDNYKLGGCGDLVAGSLDDTPNLSFCNVEDVLSCESNNGTWDDTSCTCSAQSTGDDNSETHICSLPKQWDESVGKCVCSDICPAGSVQLSSCVCKAIVVDDECTGALCDQTIIDKDDDTIIPPNTDSCTNEEARLNCIALKEGDSYWEWNGSTCSCYCSRTNGTACKKLT